MYDDNKIRSIICKMQAGLLQWIESYKPDLIRCGLQATDKNVESKEIKRGIANSLENEIGLSRRVIAYFSNPYQKNLADRLTAEIEKVNDLEISFDARQKNITIVYLPTILAINSALDDCLAAISCQQAKSLTNYSGGKAGEKGEKKYVRPSNLIGSKEIVNGHNVPRTTLQAWQEKAGIKPKKDPQTQENLYPKKWFYKKIQTYISRKKNK